MGRILTLKRARRVLWCLTGAVGAYALFGFLVLPAILKAQLPKRLGRLLGREVQIEKVRTNPFTLSITLDGVRIQDRDGQALLGWARLYVDLDASSLYTHTLALRAVRLAQPYGRLVLDREGRLNIADLLAAKPEGPKGPATSRNLWIGQLRIQGAQVTLLDRSAAQPFTTTLGPVNLSLENFHTAPGRSSDFTFAGRTEAGERFFWEGSFSAEALSSQGRLRVENLQVPKYRPYYRDRLRFDPQAGSATLAASYRFQWAPGRHKCRLRDGSLAVTGLKLVESNRARPLLELEALEAQGLEADLLERTLTLAALRLRNGNLNVVRRPDGSLNLQHLLAPDPAPPAAPAQPFQVHLRELGLSGCRASFLDQAAARPVQAAVQDLELTLRDLSLAPRGRFPLTLSLTLNHTARLALQGTISPRIPAGDFAIQMEGLGIAPFDPYLQPTLDARVNTGTLSLDGRVRFAAADGPYAFAGQVRMENLEVMDAARSEPFLRYRDLRLKGLRLTTQPQELSLQEGDLRGPEYRLVLAEDGSSNVARALKLTPGPAPAAGPGSAPAPSSAPPSAIGSALGSALPPTQGPAYRLEIKKIRMRQGRLSFLDRSVTPNAALLLSELEGTTLGLSNAREGQSELNLTGKAGAFGTLKLQGRAMPLRHDQDTDVAVQIAGADLTDFSPYAGKYLGYTIREGKLDLDARVRVQNRQLQVTDQTRMNRFYLGDPVASPDATHLPVRLGLALLRDRKGLIALDIPADGSLDDPNFRYGRMVWKAIFNALGKVVASPFTLVSNLFGGGADLSTAQFLPGASALEGVEAEKIAKLVTALRERPELHLEVEGCVDPVADGAALGRIKLEALLRRTRRETGTAAHGATALEAPLTAEERRASLLIAYPRAFPPPKGALPAPPLPTAELELRLLGTLTGTPQELRDLAQARTRTAMALLLKDDQVEATRLFAVLESPTRKAAGHRVIFTLK